MRVAGLALLCAAFTVFVGCNSGPSFNLVPRQVTIITVPPGAKVEQCDPFKCPSGYLGVSPLEDKTVAVMINFRGKNIPLALTKSFVEYEGGKLGVRITKEGYKTYTGILRTDPEKTVTHTITLEPVDQPGATKSTPAPAQ